MHANAIEALGEIEDRHWWFTERRWIIRSELRGVRPGGWAVDVGAAAGGNTRVVREAGWRCIALEYSATGAALARSRELDVVRGDATRMPIADGALDLVVAYDVLEHIEDHAAAVREFHRCLRPGGRLLVAVPADMRLWSAHDEAVDHIRRYERDELRDVVRDAGFNAIAVRSWNVLLRPAVARRRKRDHVNELELQGPIANTVLRAIIATERYVPVGRWPGVSLLLHARKA